MGHAGKQKLKAIVSKHKLMGLKPHHIDLMTYCDACKVGSAIFNVLDEVPLRMISYGGSRNNISLLVAEEYKKEALIKLHEALF